MKKLLLILAALSAISCARTGVRLNDVYINSRVGGDIGAKYEKSKESGVTYLDDKTDGFGGELALEGYKSLTDNFDLGLGLAYQFHADRKTYDLGSSKASGSEYKSLPVYLTAKYNFNLDSQIRPYLKTNLGYSFNFDSSDYKETTGYREELDIKNGLYWALGGGLEYNNFIIDLMYAVNKAESKNKTLDQKEDNDYGRVVLSAGYKFNLQ